MPLFSRSLPVALAASLTLLAGAVPAAQAQIGAKPAAPKVDPQAKTILDQAVAAQQALTALSGTVSVTTASAESAPQAQTVTLSFSKDLGAKAGVADKTGPRTQTFSDGKTLTLYDVHAKTYQSRDLPVGASAAAAAFSATGVVLAMLMGQPQRLPEIFDGKNTQVVSAGALSGLPVDVVTVTLPVTPGRPQFTIALSFGHDDHLLRQFVETITAAKGAKPLTHTETLTALTLGPTLTAADFTFTPPPGVKKVEQAAEPPMFDPRLKPGARPFPVAAKDLNGRPLSLAQYKGKVVLMDFWATWCGPCVGEMPNVIAAYKKYHAQGFDVVGISLDQDKGALLSFLKQNKMPWRQVYDGKYWDSVVPRRYGVRAIPFGLLLNRDGTIAAVEVRGEALPAAIKMALAKK